MKWMVCFFICWFVFAAAFDKKRLKRTVLAGLFSSAAQLSVDTIAIRSRLYQIQEPGLSFMGSSLFFTLGATFTMGILFAQTVPRSAGLQILNMAGWVVLFTTFETAAVHYGMMQYINWNIMMSINVNVLVMITMTWFSEHFVLAKDNHDKEKAS